MASRDKYLKTRLFSYCVDFLEHYVDLSDNYVDMPINDVELSDIKLTSRWPFGALKNTLWKQYIKASSSDDNFLTNQHNDLTSRHK